jgi:predicted component of type VI protein secretion system
MRLLPILLAGTLLVATAMHAPFAAVAAPNLLSGQVAEERVKDLTTQVQWYHNLGKAESAAKKDGKLIFWMHMLGEIDGCT